MPQSSEHAEPPPEGADEALRRAASDLGDPPGSGPDAGSEREPRGSKPPGFLFLGLVASVCLLGDAVTKAWAETVLSKLTLESPAIVLVDECLAFQLAYNQGGAFGMLAGEDASWRRPFFLLISGAAVVFIVSLYRKTAEDQWPLKWGLPLVLGGALGNLADRVTKGQVVDFIDYQSSWVEVMNQLIFRLNDGWHVTRHWPTFNLADICICIGVGLMAIDMFISKRDGASAPALDSDGDPSLTQHAAEGER
jgi:signal peptidase II